MLSKNQSVLQFSSNCMCNRQGVPVRFNLTAVTSTLGTSKSKLWIGSIYLVVKIGLKMELNRIKQWGWLSHQHVLMNVNGNANAALKTKQLARPGLFMLTETDSKRITKACGIRQNVDSSKGQNDCSTYYMTLRDSAVCVVLTICQTHNLPL